VLRVALTAGLAVVAIALTTTAHLAHAPTSALIFGAGEGAYMLGAGVLMVLGAELWLLAALAPGVVGSAAFLILGRPMRLEHMVWAALAATPLLALAFAAVFTRRTGNHTGRLFDASEWLGALPAAAFGLVAAGLLIFPVAAGVHGRGGINIGALLAALPLSLSMGAAEWSLLWYRRRTRRLLRSTRELRTFGIKARLVLVVAVLSYVAAAAVLIAATVVVASKSGLAHPQRSDLPQLGAYLILAAAMFLSLLLQAFGTRIFPLVAGSAALAFEIVARHLGVFAQIVACTELTLVVGGFALVVLGRAVRHAS
jgi:hypothetical protein